jgi:hypothetical protein
VHPGGADACGGTRVYRGDDHLTKRPKPPHRAAAFQSPRLMERPRSRFADSKGAWCASLSWAARTTPHLALEALALGLDLGFFGKDREHGLRDFQTCRGPHVAVNRFKYFEFVGFKQLDVFPFEFARYVFVVFVRLVLLFNYGTHLVDSGCGAFFGDRDRRHDAVVSAGCFGYVPSTFFSVAYSDDGAGSTAAFEFRKLAFFDGRFEEKANFLFFLLM